MLHIKSVADARPILRELGGTGQSIGSIHTLGALHNAHGELIQRSANENDQTIVTVYPNRIQLFPGSVYQYDLDADIALAESRGATIVISSDDQEMYPPEYATFIDQGERHQRLNNSVFDFASRGQVTGAIRWISLCRPTASYFGMKDIEQALLVQRATQDLMIDCEIRHVPCVRLRGSGVPLSSRLRFLPAERLAEVGSIYTALEAGRQAVQNGEHDPGKVVSLVRSLLRQSLSTFKVLYVTVVDVHTFGPVTTIEGPPFILHCAVTDGDLYHFDGLCIRTADELAHSPEVIWIDSVSDQP
ncbi:pantoate--beta-alanine ligase [Streptosporangium sp. NBC_01810]|uniref:pantoate--beta-alanine ligase n=1 Tax=Streptosporangium sp. NBC_01810 TaxID=2975951 RepID=UPI002DD82C04|nr:pantoate--beta-alanine ligase [Streptosporangium sp. NBC_01810]WSA24015.1 pantoate--beta-alanine ligase [Streptosporangium sp. NBC_01810]